MQAVRRATCALAIVLHALALAAPARAGEGRLPEAAGAPAVARVEDAAAGPGEAAVRLGAGSARDAASGASDDGLRVLRSELERLRLENEALRADVRSTDRLVGAGLLAIGMLLGALLRAAAGRRPQPRIRF